MQPYQQAGERIQQQADEPGRVARGIASAGTKIAGLAGGGALLRKALPFLNNLIPSSIAAKGLEKVDPRFGKFINSAINNGNTQDEAISFIKQKVQAGEEQDKSQAALQQKNLIEEHAPEVYEILKSKIGQGLKPLVAAFQLSKDSKHKKKIMSLQEKTGKNFSELVTSIFGSEENPQSQAALQPMQSQDQMPSSQQPQQIPGQPQANNDGSNDALMQAFQKILNM
jgi:hypothetical protein